MPKRLKEIEARLKEIRTLLEGEDKVNIDALEKETKSLMTEKKTIETEIEKRSNLINDVKGAGISVRGFVPETSAPEKKSYNAESKEYRNAFLKVMQGAEVEDLPEEERAAFTQTTVNTPNVVPTTMLNNIWNLIEEQHSILGDITVYRTGTILEVVKHTAIAAGDAKNVDEGVANDDEQNTTAKVTLSGKDFAKTVTLSYAAAKMSMPALEAYLTQEIADRIGSVMSADAVAQIISDMDTANKALTGTTTGKTSYIDLAGAFATLKRASNIKVYCNYATLYGQLVAMTDSTGRPIFQPNAQNGAEGVLIGGQVKLEDSLTDGQILIGDPTKVVYNMVQDVMIESDKDIKTHNVIYSGYARGEGALIDPKAFALYTVKAA